MNRDIKTYNHRRGTTAVTKDARISHRFKPIKQPSNIPLRGLGESISQSLVIHVDWEVFLAKWIISIIMSEPPTASRQVFVGTSTGLIVYEKRERVALCPSPERKEGGSWVVSPELLKARGVPVHISHVLTRNHCNLLEEK